MTKNRDNAREQRQEERQRCINRDREIGRESRRKRRRHRQRDVNFFSNINTSCPEVCVDTLTRYLSIAHEFYQMKSSGGKRR